MRPDLVERDLGLAIKLGADGRLVLVIRVDDDFFVAEVNCGEEETFKLDNV